MRRSIFSVLALFIISVGVLITVLFNSDPVSGAPVVRFAFFLCVWLVVWSLFTLLNMAILILTQKTSSSRGVIFRRAFELAFVVVGVILFSSLEVLNTLSLMSIILSAILLELFFISRRKEIVKR